jgi:hypothetical protein
MDAPPIVAEETAGLPAPVVADLLEAALCCELGAYRAAGLLARRTVEQVVVMRGVPLTMRTLAQKLGWLLAAGHLPRSLAAEARTLRDVGTAAAHGGDPITRTEAGAAVRAALAVARSVLLPDGPPARSPAAGPPARPPDR